MRCRRDLGQFPRHDRIYILFCQVWQRPGRVHSGKVTRPRRELRTERFPEGFLRLVCYFGGVQKSIKDRA